MSDLKGRDQASQDWVATLGRKIVGQENDFERTWTEMNAELPKVVAQLNSALNNHPTRTLILNVSSDAVGLENAYGKYINLRADRAERAILAESCWGNFRFHVLMGSTKLVAQVDSDPLPYIEEDGSYSPMMSAAFVHETFEVSALVKFIIEQMVESEQ